MMMMMIKVTNLSMYQEEKTLFYMMANMKSRGR